MAKQPKTFVKTGHFDENAVFREYGVYDVFE